MRILVVGAGDIGFQLSKKLSQDGHDITLIDADSRRVKRASEQLDALVIAGDATSYSTLTQAHLQDADLVIAMATDEVNLLICQIAKKVGVPATISRIRNPEFTAADALLSPQELGVDFFIHPEKETADAIVRLIRQSSATDVVEFAQGKLQLLGVHLDQSSSLLGAPLTEVGRQFAHIPMRIVALKRKQQTLIPSGGDVLLPEDHIFVVCDPNFIDEVLKLAGQQRIQINNIMILGGGLIGQFVAAAVAPKIKVKLIESQIERSWEIADRLEHILVIQGDGTDLDLLVRENLTEMDSFIAVTGSDETNIISTLMAKRLQVPRTIALVNKMNYIPITPAIGLDSVLSKQLLTVNAVQHYIRHQSAASVASLPGLDAEVIEYIAKAGSKIVQNPLKKVRLPRGSVIGAVVHQDQVVIPNGETCIQPGDKAVIFTRTYTQDEVGKVFGH